MSDAKRNTTPQELLGRLADSIESLDSACARYSNHVSRVKAQWPEDLEAVENPFDLPSPSPTGAIVDAAVQLRALVTKGQGNSLLFRTAELTSVSELSMTVSAPASPPPYYFEKVVTSHIAVGSLPMSDDTHEQSVSLAELLEAKCVCLLDENLGEIDMTWEGLVKQYANKLGAHVDERRPLEWDVLNGVHLADVPVMPFLLYRLATAVGELGNRVLTAGGLPEVLRDAPTWPAGTEVSAAIMTQTAKRPDFRIKSNDPCPCGSGRKWKRCHRGRSAAKPLAG